ncbi:hypothetical protein [Variovorax sp. JS1663]|uniref:hypothetical protein n=1 Tax=Variovorax sp. JS1663 TaxID=1851577 RepID=UPI000B3449F1|nr:hypothetical protein [Variovorax sp. JS1663]OUM01671.1 hypothetical protein A8M77_15470 [Variovorax sp. JS1663]
MKQLERPRIGQPIATVEKAGEGLVAKANMWLQQYLRQVGRNPVNAITTPAVGASPFVFENAGDFDVDAVVSGGTVSAVSISRDGIAYFPLASATGTTVRLNPGDFLRITYSVLPTLTLIPR